MSRHTEAPPADPRPPRPETRSRKLVEVTIDGDCTKVAATLDGSAQLQANLCWSEDVCKFEVHSVFVEPDGHATGEQFIRQVIQRGRRY